jgi:uncharacterized protein YjbI with pentapeptide repeats
MSQIDNRSKPEDRWQTIESIWRRSENNWLYIVLGLLAGLFFSPFVRQHEILGSLFPEVLGIAFTVGIIDRMNNRRANEQRKRELILQMGSPNNEFALEAVRLLNLLGWLDDGSLQKIQLENCQLQNADLRGADLRDAIMSKGDFRQASFHFANLSGANLAQSVFIEAKCVEVDFTYADLKESKFQSATLTSAKLVECSLERADFTEAKLVKANLSGSEMVEGSFEKANLTLANFSGARINFSNFSAAELCGANFEGANLAGCDFKGANLCHANLKNAVFIPSNNEIDETTIMPDGSNWSPETDCRYFTNPDWPGGFWRSNHEASPAKEHIGDSL